MSVSRRVQGFWELADRLFREEIGVDELAVEVRFREMPLFNYGAGQGDKGQEAGGGPAGEG